MGLDVSHDCWHGGYHSFNTWRDTVSRYAGYSFDLYDTENGKVKAPVIDWQKIDNNNLMGKWKVMPSDPWWIIIAHYDCDGIIQKDHVKPLYERMEQILQLIPKDDTVVYDKTVKFIEGLKFAYERNEKVTFA